MNQFMQKYQDNTIGVLSGFDRLVLRGTLRSIAFADGMFRFLCRSGVLLKDFGAYVEKTSNQLRAASCEAAERLGRPIRYLPSADTRKEVVARQIAQADGISEGLICILTCVEPCRSFAVHRDRERKRLVLESRQRKCLHLYHYGMDRDFGFMHARIQSWFPFSIQVCLNGREGLARQMDRQGSVLRVETTINRPADFRVFRPKQSDPDGPCQWQTMRTGIADLHRRAEVSQASNERYLEALASLNTDQPLPELLIPVCRPVSWRGKRVRALQPWCPHDRALLQAINRGEFAINGLRNRDLLAILHPDAHASEDAQRRAASRVTRSLRLLRAHGILRKVPRTHRYMLTTRGRNITTAILTYQNLTLEQLNPLAA